MFVPVPQTIDVAGNEVEKIRSLEILRSHKVVDLVRWFESRIHNMQSQHGRVVPQVSLTGQDMQAIVSLRFANVCASIDVQTQKLLESSACFDRASLSLSACSSWSRKVQ